jgi:hypothetical protein
MYTKRTMMKKGEKKSDEMKCDNHGCQVRRYGRTSFKSLYLFATWLDYLLTCFSGRDTTYDEMMQEAISIGVYFHDKQRAL